MNGLSVFNRLKERVQQYSPERVADITWLPAGLIYQSARMYAQNRPAVLELGAGSDQIGLNGMRGRRAGQGIVFAQ